MRAAVSADILVSACSQVKNEELSVVEFVVLQPDCLRVLDSAAVENVVGHDARPVALRRNPVRHEERGGADVEPEFFGDLTRDALVRRFACVHHASRDRPVSAVVRFHQQDLVVRVGEEHAR
jgi:hypothetical protein